MNIIKNLSVLFFAIISSQILTSCGLWDNDVVEIENGVSYTNDSCRLSVRIWNENIVQISVDPLGSTSETQSLMISGEMKKDIQIKIKNRRDCVELKTDSLRIKLSKVDLRLSFYDFENQLLLSENKRYCIPVEIANDKGYSVEQQFNIQSGEALFGLGQQQCGSMNWRNKKVQLYQQNKYVAVPSVVSSEGYGILWNNYSLTTFQDSSNIMSFSSELGSGIDYFFIHASYIDEVISGFRVITGHTPMIPQWALGYIQSKERYKSQEEIIEVAKEYRKRNIPLDLMVLDWRYWTGEEWGQKSMDNKRFPDPEGMMEMLHKQLNVHLMVSIWPKLGSATSDFMEMKNHAGFLYTPDSAFSIYDAFHPEARDLYWEQADKGLFSKGIDAWWCDATEPELMGWDWNPEYYRTIMKPYLGSGSRYMNGYSLMQSKGMYENQRKTTDQKRVMILTRSGYPGIQKYGAAIWSGDIDGTWDVFKKQIPAGLNFSMSGIPYWTTDIGGFFVYGIQNFKPDRIDPVKITDEAYKKLYVRWFQYASFCPLFRAHGTDLPREIWRFGEKGEWAYDALVKATQVRYRLMPYIYSLAWMVTSRDYTMMRALVFDFPKDTNVYNISDQFMFGPSMLINPITDSVGNARDLYLPEGNWYDFWTGEKLTGGRHLKVNSPMDEIPVFIRSGSIIPVSPDIQYANQKPQKPFEIWVYPGRDAYFEIYEDEGDNYNYEQGAYSVIPVSWNENEKVLSIGNRKGDFKGMMNERTFKIIFADQGFGTSSMGENPGIVVNYNGKPVSVKEP